MESGSSKSGNTADANTVPPELMKSVVDFIRAAEESGFPAPTAEQLAVKLRQTEGSINRACALLESHGLVRASQKTSEHTNPSYTISRQARSPAPVNETGTRDRIVNGLLRATAAVFRSDFKVDLRLAGGEIRDDQATTEDLSVFVRVNGQYQGSICFGLSRNVARALIGEVARRHITSINQPGLRILNMLADRIVALARSELGASGYFIDVHPAATVQPAGMKITTLGVRQVVATLEGRHGPIVVHVVLREAQAVDAIAA
ncbi:MAG: hypothetical protein QF554_04460 [Dehalococcoidia bacterium]|jgi:CheY-specific phosphatase CheX|nr:hypothetical protein [Dehalococcoidia bacterium]